VRVQVVETSGAELLTGGVTKLKEQLKKLEAGGVSARPPGVAYSRWQRANTPARGVS
jgi:hypothetical protein